MARPLVLLTVAAAVVRVAFLLLEPATEPTGDERMWTSWALRLASAEVGFSPLRTRMVFHPPVYPYFIALPYALAGLGAARWAQALFSVLLVPAVGMAGARTLGRRTGLVAAGIVAFYPDLVWFASHFWVETVFLVVSWWAMERLLAADEAGGPGAAAVAGVLWGLAVLTRETVLYFAPLASAWLATSRRPGAPRRALAFLAAAVLVVAPWTLRNWRVFDAFVPVSTAGGLALYQGNAPLSRQEVYDVYSSVKGRVERYRNARRLGLEAIRERQPWWLAEKLVEQMPQFWEADSLALIHIRRGAYGVVSPAAATVAAAVMLTPYLAVLTAFVRGLAALPWTRATVLLVVFLAYYNLLHVATHGFARYRLPVMPVVFLVAAWAWTRAREGVATPLGAARRVVGIAAVAVLGACVAASLQGRVRHTALGYADHGEPATEATPEEAEP